VSLLGFLVLGVILAGLGAFWWAGAGPFAAPNPVEMGNGGGIVVQIAMGTFSEASSGSAGLMTYYYNGTVVGVDTSMSWSEVHFAVQSTSGGVVEGPRSITVADPEGSCVVAAYTFAASAWSAPAAGACQGTSLGGGAAIVGGGLVQLTSSADLGGLGNTLVLSGHGRFAGTESFQIP
jgi:hypothetical protein